jgi:hypothetical protein
MTLTRRAVIRNLGLAAGLTAALPWRKTRGASSVRLDVNDPAAIALGYVENAAQVDAKKYPDFAPGSTCENCLLLQGSAGNDYRPCSLFPDKLVSVGGWCKGWTPEI